MADLFLSSFILFRLQLREKAAAEDKSKIPPELREKKTRAIRRRLTAAQVHSAKAPLIPLAGPPHVHFTFSDNSYAQLTQPPLLDCNVTRTHNKLTPPSLTRL